MLEAQIWLYGEGTTGLDKNYELYCPPDRAFHDSAMLASARCHGNRTDGWLMFAADRLRLPCAGSTLFVRAIGVSIDQLIDPHAPAVADGPQAKALGRASRSISSGDSWPRSSGNGSDRCQKAPVPHRALAGRRSGPCDRP